MRTEVVAGEFWRLFTGHWVHVSGAHLIGNLALIVVAGGLLERRSRGIGMTTIGLAVLAIGPVLFVFVPDRVSAPVPLPAACSGGRRPRDDRPRRSWFRTGRP
ncbi:MAG: rhomboid family intramembrane serine protease [Verrucomicrobiae bacterium]|nr:rhomboid family intramembrane serine protease [Verrucomicrobiae bacterium]